MFPAVTAALDQHAAAVRDILELGIDNPDRVPVNVLLAGYARGLLEHCGPRYTPDDAEQWTQACWMELRLASVCQLALLGTDPVTDPEHA